jgi:hypothetical protein
MFKKEKSDQYFLFQGKICTIILNARQAFSENFNKGKKVSSSAI